ncbi:basic 7S globulin [Brachypodium distachyon]|uniref:Peptidase A1 domain-containing protein n=1 Tax=Brachypodium distachyon TaxID=15368 RepID=I1HBP0_BRADI|nr:basic 7S globulin [Brachypodium distachyon]KQK02539.1 hypothetical protein BRADI_2g02140v3 [Brachypodium distachyon]|eukprot:XP_010232953.1 basic 7S globulin [Brachypodium distachyon]
MWHPKTILLALVLVAVSLRACTGSTTGLSGKPLVTDVSFNPTTHAYTSPLDHGRPLLLDVSGAAISMPCTAPTPPPTTKVTLVASETDGKKLLQQVNFPATASCGAPPVDGAIGVAGLGPSPLSFSSQVASLQKIPNKFALCLSRNPNSPGAAIFGGGPLFSPEVITTRLTRRPAEILDVTKIMSPEIPLRLPPHAGALHQVSARGIAVDGKPLAVTGGGQPIDIGFSTRNPYTELRDDVYRGVLDGIERALGPNAAGAKVPATAPFELCYDLKRLNVYVLPRVEFMLEGGQSWNIVDKADVHDMEHSGVQAVSSSGNNAACFPYVRMKQQPSEGMPAVVIGGFHMAHRVVVFDQDKQKLSFTPSFISDQPALGCGRSA